jgi:hypothetical protein
MNSDCKNNGRPFLGRAACAVILFVGIASAPSAQAQDGAPPFRPGAHPRGNRPPGALPPIPQMPRSFLPPTTAPAGKKTTSGEEFFIVASVDQSKSQVLLKHPTEVTLLAKVDPSTQYTDDAGKPLKLSDFRAGDTVWVTLSGGTAGTGAMRVRKGEMTEADLHRYYLDYPVIK